VSETNIGDLTVQAVGMDCIWQNIDTTHANTFTTLRKWIHEDVDAIIMRIAGHVQNGLYRLVAVQVSKHSLVVVCMYDKPLEEFPADALDGQGAEQDKTFGSGTPLADFRTSLKCLSIYSDFRLMVCFCLYSSSTELIELNWKNRTHSLISVTVHVTN
jgi:hypothetical protein